MLPSVFLFLLCTFLVYEAFLNYLSQPHIYQPQVLPTTLSFLPFLYPEPVRITTLSVLGPVIFGGGDGANIFPCPPPLVQNLENNTYLIHIVVKMHECI